MVQQDGSVIPLSSIPCPSDCVDPAKIDSNSDTCPDEEEDDTATHSDILDSDACETMESDGIRHREDPYLQSFRLAIVNMADMMSNSYESVRSFLEQYANKDLRLEDGRIINVSLKTLERWYRKFRENGKNPDSMAPVLRSDEGTNRKLLFPAKNRIREIIKEAPTARATAIHARLIKEKIIRKDEVCVETIRRFIKKNKLRVKPAADARIRHSYSVKDIGILWQADTCYFYKIYWRKKKCWVYVQGIIDHHARYLVAMRCYMEDTAANFRQTLYYAMSHYYIPRMIVVDNGSAYIDKDLIDLCNRLNVVLIHTRSNDGASKGCIERTWLSLEDQTLVDIVLDKPETLEEVQALVDKWVEEYHLRVNTGINAKPMDMYMASAKRHITRKPESAEWLHEQFLHEEPRRVHNDTTVVVSKVAYRVPDELAREKWLKVRYDPEQIEETISVWHEGKKYPLKKDDREANAHEKRNTGGRKTELKERSAAKAEAIRQRESQLEKEKSDDWEQAEEAMKKQQEAEMKILRSVLEAGDSQISPETLSELRAEERYKRRMAGTSLLDAENASETEAGENSMERTPMTVNFLAL